MTPILHTIPGYTIYEYLLVLNPGEELRNRIQKLKEEFAQTYDIKETGWGRPQLVLLSFTQYALMEERIRHRLRMVAMGFPSFKVELKDFGSFPSHTLFINVASRVALKQLVKSIRAQGQRLMKLDEDHKPHFILEPYIGIARKLQPWQYEKGWLEFSHRHFTGRFIADHMTLLRRKQGETRYQPVENFEFRNMPVTTKQGELFQ